MKNITLIICVLFLFSVNVHAGVCNNGSLSGSYGFLGTGVGNGNSYETAGKITFNGAGTVTVSGVDNESGFTVRNVSGSGTYSVSSGCVATGSLNLNVGMTVNFWLYLDQMNYALPNNLAYHASAFFKIRFGGTYAGEINRAIGKLQ